MSSFIAELDDGRLTIKRYNELVANNEKLAKEHSIRLSISFVQSKLRGRVYDGERLHQERFYQGEYMHILLARMHWDFNLALQPLIENNKKARQAELIRQQKEAEEEEWQRKATIRRQEFENRNRPDQ